MPTSWPSSRARRTAARTSALRRRPSSTRRSRTSIERRETMEQENDRELNPADLSARVVAFAIDAALFGLLYLISFWLLFPGYPIIAYKAAPLWHLPWILAFVIYQAYFSAEGRVSVGKSLMELRVVDGEGEALALDSALIRSVTYLVSAIGGLGFA